MNKIWDYIIVGAGICGAYCASRISDSGSTILVIDKARGSGGRLSSKRLRHAELPKSFDLGAQIFEIRSQKFESFLTCQSGVRVFRRDGLSYGVVEGRNSALTRSCLENVDTSFETRVLSAEKVTDGWLLICEKSGAVASYRTKQLILATPPLQAAQALGQRHVFFNALSRVQHEAQWVMMVATKGLELRSDVFDKVNVKSDAIQAVYVDNAKRSPLNLDEPVVWLIHAKDAWTRQHLECSPEHVSDALLENFNLHASTRLTLSDKTVLGHHIHRWRYARPKSTTRMDSAFLAEQDSLFICGDYYSTGSDFGVEAAFLSGAALCDQLRV